MKIANQKIYKAALYLRLSIQNLNEDTGESDSIANQEALLRAHLKGHPEIEIKHIFKDDGWSGVSFNRPGFQKMMQKIYDDEIDCVVVKDLSRLGRNHTETGKYITRVFPAFGVRFIAVNDNIDSLNDSSDADNIIIPFKNLLNDSYSRDISTKVRSAMAIKKAKGDFGGGFYPYGYTIDPKNVNHYVIDEEAAEVVRKIFRWTFDGMGSSQIVRQLNTLHIPCPSEHKRKNANTDNYEPNGKKWNIYQIYRILRNDVYIGTLRLGKTTTPNYKVKKVIQVPEEDQYVFENAHAPIISKTEFELMQDLLSRDSRVHGYAGANSYVYPLTGYIFCADCGSSMIVKSVTSKGHRYRYYVCGENKRNKAICSPHHVSYDKVCAVVLKALNKHLKVLLNAEEFFDSQSIVALARPRIEELQIEISKVLEKKNKISECIRNLYRDYKDDLLTEAEYLELKADYEAEAERLQQDAAKLEMQRQTQVDTELGNMEWIRRYREKGELTELTRRDVAVLIDRVEVTDEEHIKVKFRFGDEYGLIMKRQKRALRRSAGEEAVVNG